MNFYDLLHEGRIDELVNEAYPVLETDKDAERAFLRVFQDKYNMFLLDEEDSVSMLRDEAEAGNRYAQYAYARWQCFVRGGEESLWISYRNMKAAAEQDLADAYAGLAQVYKYGDIGNVDYDEADKCLSIALTMGSELAKQYLFKDLLYGARYQPAQPEKAETFINKVIAEDEANGIAPNGYWYYARALARERRLGRTRVIDDYQRAVELGYTNALTDLIIAYGYGDDTKVLVETKEYSACINEGLARRVASAHYFEADREMHRYDALLEAYRDRNIQFKSIPYDTLQICHEAILGHMSQAARLGDATAWVILGDMYHEGTYGFDKDKQKAFTCYSNGTIHDVQSAVERLWKMMHDHEVDRPQDYMDSIALHGARYGSPRLLAETVIAKQQGRLAEYADEISKYYEPVFDSPEFTLDSDDWMGVIGNMLDDDDDPDLTEDENNLIP